MFISSDWFSEPMKQYTKFVKQCMEEFAMKENQNKAPKILEGGYYLTIHDNEIILYSDRDGTTTIAKCHPDDKFNLKYGLDVVFGQMIAKKQGKDKEIKAGDEVEIVDTGKMYTTYPEWLCRNCDFEFVKSYAYKNIGYKGLRGTVIAVAPHGTANRVLAAIYSHGSTYLIDVEGLKKVGLED